MSWQELLWMQQEIADIRNRVGGESVELSESFTGKKPVVDQLNDVKAELKNAIAEFVKLKTELGDAKSAIDNLASELSVLKTTGVVDQESETKVEAISKELKASTDELDTTVKKNKK
jgi:uncharacterized coiled-coil DUF342 family protein